ncbi:AMP-binding protein [Streptomyces sp. NPDC093510]|uniref:AMP-binding protein n=1 Tax=Streptomyces sp. NPDC093510 TaxID=3155199 RepID=UPI00342B89B1
MVTPPRKSPRTPTPPRTSSPLPPPSYEEMPLAPRLAALRPPAGTARLFTQQGWWRAETVLHDVYRGAARHPHRTAIVSHHAQRPAAGRVRRISYAQLAACTDRFAHALDALGVRAGDPVAFQLPNRWEACALLLACLRTGAVAVPVMPGYGARDLAAVLGAAQARLCVVPDQWEGVAPARILAGLAPALPWLRHRAVLGEAAGDGALDFTRHFLRTPHERHRPARLPLPPGPADRICLAVTSLGLHAAHHMTLHTPNSLHAALPAPHGAGESASFTALPLAALPSLLHAVIGPLTRGATVVLQDLWDPEAALDLMAEVGVGQVCATPAQWAELAAAQERRPRALDELRHAVTSGPAEIPAALARQVRHSLRVPLRAAPRPAWQQEAGRAPGGPGRAAYGPSSPSAVWRPDGGGLRPAWAPAGGAGGAPRADLDETGRARLRTEEVGGLFLLPVTEIEERLLAHPRVAEAAVVACTDPHHGELACAAVVPDGEPPTLRELREHLLGQGVAPAHLPAHLELMGGLPRAANGELHRRRLQFALARRPTRSA